MSEDKIKISMTSRRPLSVAEAAWPVIAEARDHDGQVRCQANTEWEILVREHEDGRRIVYGWKERGKRGQHIGFCAVYAGFVAEAGDECEESTIHLIRKVAALIGREDLGLDCIQDLPAEEM